MVHYRRKALQYVLDYHIKHLNLSDDIHDDWFRHLSQFIALDIHAITDGANGKIPRVTQNRLKRLSLLYKVRWRAINDVGKFTESFWNR